VSSVTVTSVNKRFAMALVVLLFLPISALAQVDLSGGWDTIRHEDEPERGMGPEIGDYSGISLNAEARFESRHVGRGEMDTAGTRMRATPRRLRGAWRGRYEGVGGCEPSYVGSHRMAHPNDFGCSRSGPFIWISTSPTRRQHSRVARLFDRGMGARTC
jgi:hypothetical protein